MEEQQIWWKEWEKKELPLWGEISVLSSSDVASIKEKINKISEKLRSDIDNTQKIELSKELKGLYRLLPDNYFKYPFEDNSLLRWEMIRRLQTQSFKDIKILFEMYDFLSNHFIDLNKEYFLIFILLKSNVYKIWKDCSISYIEECIKSILKDKLSEKFLEILEDILSQRQQWAGYIYWLTDTQMQFVDISSKYAISEDIQEKKSLKKQLKDLWKKIYS